MRDYRDAIVDRALPVWATRGFDTERGRFRERLALSGTPIDLPHRCMVQARQIYVFAEAARIGWFLDGGPLAEQAMANLLRVYGEDAREGGLSFGFSADADLRCVSDVRDAYTHAFVLFALASLYRLNNNPSLLEVAERTVAFIDREMIDPVYGGLFDELPLRDGQKRQNPVMHLLEAYLFLDTAAPGHGYLERAAKLVVLFKTRLFQSDRGILLEYFDADWSPHRDSARGAIFEPGHHFEWVWLLDRFQKQGGADHSETIAKLHQVAITHGIARNGLIFDEVGNDMRPLKRSHRVWPHTEAIKAAVARHGAGDSSAAAFAKTMSDRLLNTFLDRPFVGGWIDHVREDGTRLVDYVPASSLYHLFLAATEAVKLPTPEVAAAAAV
jgi:mannose/cellobiose epimerase-like protein (N-acyl-D-glucosamine 2-epimerase family)